MGYNQPCLVCGETACGRVPIEAGGEERLVDLCEPHLEELAGSTDRAGYLSAEE